MGIGNMLKGAKVLSKARKVKDGASVKGLFDVYEAELLKAKEGIKFTEEKLEKAKERGDDKKIKKLEKRLAKMEKSIKLVEEGITSAVSSIGGGMKSYKIDNEEKKD